MLQSVGAQVPQPVAQRLPIPCDINDLIANAFAGRDGSEGGGEVEVDQKSLNYQGPSKHWARDKYGEQRVPLFWMMESLGVKDK